MPSADPSLSVAQRVDAACDRFEAEWKAGRRPQIEDYLAAAPEADRATLRQALVAVETELRAYPAATETVTQNSARTTDHVPAGGAADTPARTAEAVPKVIGRFEVRSILGAGAFGRVYRAFDPQLGREVAIKVPLEETIRSATDRDRFLKEARAAATINHPNVCQIHEVGEHAGRPYIVMALVPGQSLADVLKARKEPLAAKQAALIVRKVALALVAAHGKGIVHRDLKPANIMFDKERKDIVVMDFGLARGPKLASARATQSGVIMGTPAYMSPEQARGEAKGMGPAGDVFSLGVILYELLTGTRPFNGTATEVIGQILHVEPEPPSKRRPNIDPQLEAACLKAMAKDPAARFASMKEFATAIDAAMRAPTPAGPAAATKPRARATRLEQEEASSNLSEVFAVMSVERKGVRAETTTAVKAARAKHRTPRWVFLLVGGLGAGALIMLASIVFFTRSDAAKVNLSVMIKDVDLQDKTLSFYLNEQSIGTAALATPVELKPGVHIFTVKRGQTSVKRIEIRVDGGKAPAIKVADIPPPPPTQTTPPTTTTTADDRATLQPMSRTVPTPPSYVNHKPGLIWSAGPGTSWWWCACFSRRGDYVAAGEQPQPNKELDNIMIRVWPITNTQMGKDSLVLRHRVSGKAWQTGMVFAPNGRQLASAARDGSICLWDMDAATPTLLARLQRFDGILTALAFSPDGRYFAAGARKEGSPVCLWDLSEPTKPKETYSFTPQDQDPISSLVFSPDSQVLYIGTGKTNVGARVYAWRYRHEANAALLWKHVDGPWVRSLDITRDGTLLGLTHGDKAEIIDPKTGAPRLTLVGHEPGKAVQFLAFSADGSRCVTAGYDKSVRAWSTSDGKQLWQNDVPGGLNEGGGISPDGLLAFTSSHLVDSPKLAGVPHVSVGNVAQLWRLPDSVPPLPSDDLKLLQGEWDVWAEEFFGLPVKDELIREMQKTLVFAKDRLTMYRSWKDGKRLKTEGTIRIDASANPKTIDCTGTDYFGKLFAFRGLYELNGDALRLVYNNPGLTGDSGLVRPTAFRTVAKTPTVLIHAKRKQPQAGVAAPTDPGFVPLFNSKDLSGWKAVDNSAWRIEGGELIGENVQGTYERGWLFTDRDYRDFMLRCEYRGDRLNSGIALRAVPEDAKSLVHVEVDIAAFPGQPAGSLVWGTRGKGVATVPALGPVPSQEWQHMEMTLRGSQLTVWLNGVAVLSQDLASLAGKENALPGLKRIAGRIGLQASGAGNAVRFRKVEIKELTEEPSAPANMGFVPLFNGTDLSGWRVPQQNGATWLVKEGELVAVGANQESWLLTDQEFGDFTLRLQFRTRLNSQTSGGVGFRLQPTDDRPMSIKLMDDDSRSPWSVQQGERTGAFWLPGRDNKLDMLAPPRPARLRPVRIDSGQSDWNQVELTVAGSAVTLKVNNDIVQALNLAERAIAVGESPPLTRKSGRIGLQIKTSIMRFRDIEVWRQGGT